MDRMMSKIDVPLDYVGQERVKKYLFYIFSVGYTFALLMGFLLSNLFYTLVLGMVTFLVATVAVVPSWPFYRRNTWRFRDAAPTKNK